MEEHLRQVYQKLASFCAYQERTHEEVRKKLDQLFVEAEEADFLIAELIQNNFLNEQRFANSFAGGKFRIKKWGKRKILFELKQKHISERNIESALKAIEKVDYQSTLLKLAQKKLEALEQKESNRLLQKKKLAAYLIQKGYEQKLIWELFDSLFPEKV